MSCANVPAELDAYADGELEAGRDVAFATVSAHLETCAACRSEVANIQALSASLRTHLPRYGASDTLRARANAMTRASTPSPSTAPAAAPSTGGGNTLPFWKTCALAASLLLAVVSAHDLTRSSSAQHDGSSVNQQLIDAHIRALMLDHLVDVPSTDRHTVKPWFEGKVNFSPSVFDFAADSFPLAGGRLDYAAGHATAAIVFHRGQHAINLFVWASDSTDANVQMVSQNGFNVASWRRNHLQYSAVSTLNRSSLAQFAALYVARDSTTDAVQR